MRRSFGLESGDVGVDGWGSKLLVVVSRRVSTEEESCTCAS